MRRFLVFSLVLALLLAPCGAFGEEEGMPEWTYPLAPEILANPNGYITLANTESLLDGDYEPEDLENVTVKKASSAAMQMRREAHAALHRMFDAAEAAGYTLYAKSVYRSYQTQKTMYANRLEKVGYDDGVVAYPGSSDHQTGLGIDILNYEWTQKEGMTPAFAETPEAQWMAAHCQEFGFILRYMEDKEDITKIIFEPWHFRYVGPEAAEYIMANHLSLEEFTAEWQAYVAEYEQNGGDFERLVLLRSLMDPVQVVDVTGDGEEEFSF